MLGVVVAMRDGSDAAWMSVIFNCVVLLCGLAGFAQACPVWLWVGGKRARGMWPEVSRWGKWDGEAPDSWTGTAAAFGAGSLPLCLWHTHTLPLTHSRGLASSPVQPGRL